WWCRPCRASPTSSARSPPAPPTPARAWRPWWRAISTSPPSSAWIRRPCWARGWTRCAPSPSRPAPRNGRPIGRPCGSRRARAAQRPLDWQAELLAQGELLSSTLGAAYLRAAGLDFAWCDARDWLHAVALPNQNEWARRLSVSCGREVDAGWRGRFDAQPGRMLLTQGFIARHDDGGTAVLGRGGSDTSAACFGALLAADCVEIWTDVPGMFSANPREVPDARLLTRLDYAEAQEICTTGAKVLHPRAIKPCRDAGVPMA